MVERLQESDGDARMVALAQLIGWARGDHYCKRCKGAGELDYPQVDEPVECPDCAGEGEALDG